MEEERTRSGEIKKKGHSKSSREGTQTSENNTDDKVFILFDNDGLSNHKDSKRPEEKFEIGSGTVQRQVSISTLRFVRSVLAAPSLDGHQLLRHLARQQNIPRHVKPVLWPLLPRRLVRNEEVRSRQDQIRR
jgi:hypothetical protein